MLPNVPLFIVRSEFENAIGTAKQTPVRSHCAAKEAQYAERQKQRHRRRKRAAEIHGTPVHKHSAAVVFVARYSSDAFLTFHEVIERNYRGLLLRQRVDCVHLEYE